MYLSILEEAFIINLRDSCSNVLNKINIISAASFLFRINFKGVPFVESNGFLSNVEGESIFI